MPMMLTIILLFGFCWTIKSQSAMFYGCDFEQKCQDFVFDSYWIVRNISSHPDHTYGNISGHYISYTNTSTSQPLTTFRTQNWIDSAPADFTTCLSNWISSGPGGFYYDMELAQGDDLQARLPVGRFGMNINSTEWIGSHFEFPYVNRFIPFILFTNITSAVDIDDLWVFPCPSSKPIPPVIAYFECDFDQTLCPELMSLSNYAYNWSRIQAEEAQNYTSTAPAIDYSVGNERGHYIWLNNSDELQPGGAGYLITPVLEISSSDSVHCLSFQYYRFGLTFQTSRLTVLALDDRNEKKFVQQIWPINPMNYTYINNRWSWAYTPLPIGNYSLLFRMDSENEVSSSFALDSISVHSCGYMQSYFYGTSYLDFACDFNSHYDLTCGIWDDYTDLDPRSVINYTIQSPNTIADRELGPRQTTGWSGEWFLYWSRSEQTSSTLTKGQFKTPLIETNRDMCIRFAYFVNSTGVQPDEKNTKIQITARGCHTDTLWSIELDHSNGWQLVTTPFHHTACTQGIYFQITQQRPTRVAVAFDDITIAQCGSLDVLTTTVAPPTTTNVNKSSLRSTHSILLIIALFIYLFFNK